MKKRIGGELRAWSEVVGLQDEPLTHRHWHLSFQGRPVNPNEHSCLVRSVLDVPVEDAAEAPEPSQASTTQTLDDFVTFLGYELDYEYVLRGQLFQHHNIEVRVFQIFRFREPGVLETVHPLASHQWLAEITSLATDSTLLATQDRLKSFADELGTIASFRKVVM